MRSCSLSASPVLRRPDGCRASSEFSFSSLQKCVNHLLASGCTKASLCPYAIADVALMHLKLLNGSLLTSSLHPYFMIVAENSNIDTQLYVMRMLIDRLPMAQYTLLKDMALLWFKQSTFGNNWVHVLKLGSLLGPLFVKEKDRFSILCRHLTVVEAATRLVTLLVKQWNYIFYTGSPSSPSLEHRDDTLTNQIQRSKGSSGLHDLFGNFRSTNQVNDSFLTRSSKPFVACFNQRKGHMKFRKNLLASRKSSEVHNPHSEKSGSGSWRQHVNLKRNIPPQKGISQKRFLLTHSSSSTEVGVLSNHNQLKVSGERDQKAVQIATTSWVEMNLAKLDSCARNHALDEKKGKRSKFLFKKSLNKVRRTGHCKNAGHSRNINRHVQKRGQKPPAISLIELFYPCSVANHGTVDTCQNKLLMISKDKVKDDHGTVNGPELQLGNTCAITPLMQPFLPDSTSCNVATINCPISSSECSHLPKLPVVGNSITSFQSSEFLFSHGESQVNLFCRACNPFCATTALQLPSAFPCLPTLHKKLSSMPTPMHTHMTCAPISPPPPPPPPPTPPPPPPPPPSPPPPPPGPKVHSRSPPPPPPQLPRSPKLESHLQCSETDPQKCTITSPDVRKPRMKQLIWNKITGAMTEKTVWENTTLEPVNLPDLKLLESLFSANPLPSHGQFEKNVLMRKKPSGIHVIDMKRAHNVSIQLSSLRKPFLELCKALHEIDERILTNEALTVLYRTLPTKEDISSLKEYKGDPLQLAEVEKYYLEIMLIPRVDKKIRVLNFKSQCSHLIQQIKQDLLLLQNACAELKGSEKFVKLLEAVLVIGNYLNGDSSRGHAKGFKLDALLKLMDVKGSNRQTTLLHFVVVELVKVDEQFLTLPDEFNGIKPASSLKLENIIASISDLDRGLDITKKEIEFARADLSNVSALRSKFLELILPFYEDCSAHVFELKELLNITLSKLKDVSEYFGESGDDQPPRQMDLFRTMHQFLSMFDNVSKEILEKRAHHKVDQRNDKAQLLSKIRKCEDNKAAASLPRIVKEIDDNKAKASVREKSSQLNKSLDSAGLHDSPRFGNDGDKENQQPVACVEEIEATKVATKPLLAQLPLKANSHNAPHYLGYDSDWSTG